MSDGVACVATPQRLRWAMLRAGWPPERCGVWLSMGVSMNDARKLAAAADVALAALYLPDPSRWEMFKAWIHGRPRAWS